MISSKVFVSSSNEEIFAYCKSVGLRACSKRLALSINASYVTIGLKRESGEKERDCLSLGKVFANSRILLLFLVIPFLCCSAHSNRSFIFANFAFLISSSFFYWSSCAFLSCKACFACFFSLYCSIF